MKQQNRVAARLSSAVGVGMKNRRSIRRKGHDYAAAGHYFVTVCVRNRDPLLGVIDGETMGPFRTGADR